MLNENSTAHDVELQNKNSRLQTDKIVKALYGMTPEEMMRMAYNALEIARVVEKERQE